MIPEEKIVFLLADEQQLNALCDGIEAGHETLWPRRINARYKADQLGILARKNDAGTGLVRPLAIVVSKDDQRRLYGRFSSLRSEYSPLSAWCHIFDPQVFETLDSVRRVPNLNGLEAAWSGLTVAETVLLANRSPETLKIAGCFATATFAIARSIALWPMFSVDDVLFRYEQSNRIIRGAASSNELVKRLDPIWRCLIETSNHSLQPQKEVSRILGAIISCRSSGNSDESFSILKSLNNPGDHQYLSNMNAFSPEERVGIFDSLVHGLRAAQGNDKEVFALLAGYVATIAAGGSPSLTLAEEISAEFPEVLAWAYVIGGIGEKVLWTSSFYGLGRLVWREITRPFHIDEAPTCDFNFEEANHLVDKQLNDPFVHLRIKQQRLLTVSIMPGVNISIPINENQEVKAAVINKSSSSKFPKELVRLMDDLWPLIEARLIDEGYADTRDKSRLGNNRKKGGQGRLPLR